MKKIWLIGAGGIAEEYAKVLKALGKDFIVIGRGEKSASVFKEHVGETMRLLQLLFVSWPQIQRNF